MLACKSRRTVSEFGFALQVGLGVSGWSSLTMPQNQRRPIDPSEEIIDSTKVDASDERVVSS